MKKQINSQDKLKFECPQVFNIFHYLFQDLSSRFRISLNIPER
ncbi:hypothetical protein LDG_6898 [Legionella drancourtii LLAP12]|uniref:Uncharacterized protein n=1 Tax=Legionella drancourtii LLAP12 TaxID=658187 RepID=G9ENS1_9GAMM|nr:hypothetical protein LDG_6898 [Legionella drancourtii LLAP12]